MTRPWRGGGSSHRGLHVTYVGRKTSSSFVRSPTASLWSRVFDRWWVDGALLRTSRYSLSMATLVVRDCAKLNYILVDQSCPDADFLMEEDAAGGLALCTRRTVVTRTPSWATVTWKRRDAHGVRM